MLATLTALTARTVADAARRHGVTEVDRLRRRRPQPDADGRAAPRSSHAVALLTSDALGLPAQAKEAYAFALLGFLTHHGIAGTLAERDRRPPRERARLHHTGIGFRDPAPRVLRLG